MLTESGHMRREECAKELDETSGTLGPLAPAMDDMHHPLQIAKLVSEGHQFDGLLSVVRVASRGPEVATSVVFLTRLSHAHSRVQNTVKDVCFSVSNFPIRLKSIPSLFCT